MVLIPLEKLVQNQDLEERVKENGTIVTQTALEKALAMALKKGGIDRDIQNQAASLLNNFFGFNNEIPDNRLYPEEKDVFYQLEEYNLVGMRWEKPFLADIFNPKTQRLEEKKEYRLHYWVWRRDVIFALAKLYDEREREKEKTGSTVANDETDVYAQADIWVRPVQDSIKP